MIYNINKFIIFYLMGGEVFDDTIVLTKDDYDKWIADFLSKIKLIYGKDYMLPYRLQNKVKYSDIDFIVHDCNKMIDEIKDIDKPKLIKKIKLYDEKFDSYSMHVLTNDNIQIDILKAWTEKSIEMTQIYYSYSCANIFFKKLVTCVSDTFKLSYMGLFCCNNKYIIPDDIESTKIDKNIRLITDPMFFFNFIDLNYEEYKKGFNDEYDMLKYFEKSKYYNKIKFIVNSKFKHDCKRLETFNNLYINNLLKIDNKL